MTAAERTAIVRWRLAEQLRRQGLAGLATLQEMAAWRAAMAAQIERRVA